MSGRKLSPAKFAAYVALTSAMLTGVQLALYALPGVECVTVLLLCTSYSFGWAFGFMTGLTFSLLRCMLFGFYPSAVLLYCIYFPLFGLIFGLTGRLKDDRLPAAFKVGTNIVLAALACLCFCTAALRLIKLSPVYRDTVYAMLWALGGISAAMLTAFDALWAVSAVKGVAEKPLRLFFITALAALCTVCFTLLDDVITPLVVGMTATGALAYFYASFTAMLPQTICAVCTVSVLFYPLTSVLKRIK